MTVANPIGTLYYNGYTFGGASEVRCRTERVRDDSGRAVIYVRHIIDVKAYISVSGGTNTTMESIRLALGADGAPLRCTGFGYGNDIVVNFGGVRDLKWGPKTEELSWEPTGSVTTCLIRWRVTTCLPCCCNRYSGVLALNWSASHSINHRGSTTRTVNGYIEIANTFVGSGMGDSADNYRGFFKLPELPGYLRTQSWSISADKSRIDFTITDAKVSSPKAYPPGLVKIDADHSINWGLSSAGKIMHTLSASMERLPIADMSYCWAVFAALYQACVKGLNSDQQTKVTMVQSISASTQIFGWSCNFSLSFVQFKSLANKKDEVKEDLVTVTNLDFGKNLPAEWTWANWSRAIAGFWGPYGTDNLSVAKENDAIITICNPVSVRIPAVNVVEEKQTRSNNPPQLTPGHDNQGQKITKKNSILESEAFLIIYSSRGVSSASTMYSDPVELLSESDDYLPVSGSALHRGAKSIDQLLKSTTINTGKDRRTILQSNNSIKWEFELYVRIVRIGLPIPKPKTKTSINGVDVVLKNDTWAMRSTAHPDGSKMYTGEGVFYYVSEGALRKVQAPISVT